ncbi:MAG: hydrogenase 4 subunit F [Candidatus Eremiobacteraeota bacterium]|nr:hydrogenase 4 subunit F [Candidatus Eremiobacteraeota bacterium]
MTLRLAIAVAAPLVGAILATPLRTRDVRRVVRNFFSVAGVGAAVYAIPDLDVLSALFTLTISFVSAAALAFSTSIFPSRERVDSGWSTRPAYYLLFGAFWSSMLFTVANTSFIGIWLGISGTTLATTFLVGFSGGISALEAAWKYLILCSFGIAIALLGILLLGRAAMLAGVPGSEALSWGVLASHVSQMPPGLVRVALVLVCIGFATKAGLVPMHSWLPDAHSKAPAAVSALLSGLLVSCALYALVRAQALAAIAIPHLFDGVLLTLGGLSILVGSVLMLSQHDLKRLFSYSTIEHSGLVTVALAIGTPLGLFAAIFHLLNHAFAKSAAFLACGMVFYERGTTRIGALRGLLSSASGKVLLFSIVGLAGFPPMGMFVSELLILVAAIAARNWAATSLAGAGLVLGFAALARLAVDTESGDAPAHHTPRLALAAAGCLCVAMIAGAIVPFVPWSRII